MSISRIAERIHPTWAALAIVGVVYFARFIAFEGPVVQSDGRYSWIMARSLAFDGDLHLANDYALCGDPWGVGRDEGAGRPANPFYLGPALVWAPLLRLARAVVPVPDGSPRSWRAGCEGTLAHWTLICAPLFGLLTLWLGARIARRWVSERASAGAILIVGFGSTLLHFSTLVPSYSHVWAAFSVALSVLAWVRAAERPDAMPRWYAAGLAAGLAALMRSQAAVMLLAPAATLLYLSITRLRGKTAPWRELIAGALVVAGFISVYWIQLHAYRLLYGHPFVIPQGRTYLALGHAHPFLLLFAPHGGLLSCTPLMWLGVIGLVWMVLKSETRGIGIPLFLVLAIDLFVSSAVLDWHGNATFGARRLTVLAGPFILPTALTLAAAWRWLSRRSKLVPLVAAGALFVPWLVINYGASSGNIDGRIPFEGRVSGAELYGNGLRYGIETVSSRIGNPAVLPATVVFALRYRAGPREFDRVAVGGFFRHSYRPVKMTGCDTIRFADAKLDVVLVKGLTRIKDGVVLGKGLRGRILFPLAWPFVSHIELDASPVRPGGAVTLSMRNAGFLSAKTVGKAVFDHPGQTVKLPVPARAFDSGINEMTFEAGEDLVLRSLKFFDERIHDTSVF